MPDWTYHPLRPITARLLGRRRSERAALRFLATLTSRPAGARAVAAVFAHPAAPPGLAGRLGATVPVRHARDAIRALPVQGAGVIEIGPVTTADVPAVRAAATGRRCPVWARPGDPETAAAVAPYVDRVVTTEAAVVRLTDPDIETARRALADPDAVVLATPALLVAAGPGWFQRVIEAETPAGPAPSPRDAGPDPRRWPAWLWALLVGLGMIGGGVGAALITLGPVLLWYDNDYLGMRREQLAALNDRLVPFLQHDRITMAGTMVAIGILYAGLAWGGLRQGWPWARRSLLLSGAVGFPSILYFLGTGGFVEPLHAAVTIVLAPMFVLAVTPRIGPPRWTLLPDGPEPERRRALTGQLLMIVTGAGLLIGGVTVSVVGFNDVYVATDLDFLGTHAGHLEEANDRLRSFVAHDRAGFGGALIAAALSIVTLSMWGWRRGSRWVWWTLAGSATAGFLPAVAVHMVIGYTDAVHLAPVYVGITLSIASLTLSRRYLCAKEAA
ncbi:hypothetical protein Aph02nite_14520 [Actinoplanes philippinensis]|uniref:Uncharacterized protein n=1 Tax=Actinoplanes philippinensis TaxID=35752 RepID=A0A1I1ZG81_9ACTN|nr:hypothetical protein [Actinoplanes philippinensis]GIE75502.1 hypothetical protein Aph02nite_14520 [Actinoplanes philippinensis]SFE30655.1 hypothetical protein SAMN05421541_10185 [Actinoplanes philippinensis]